MEGRNVGEACDGKVRYGVSVRGWISSHAG